MYLKTVYEHEVKSTTAVDCHFFLLLINMSDTNSFGCLFGLGGVIFFAAKQVDADGHAHATLPYPSMEEIWPEMYRLITVREIEVCCVCVYSRSMLPGLEFPHEKRSGVVSFVPAHCSGSLFLSDRHPLPCPRHGRDVARRL